MAGRRSLRDELEELINPMPEDIDPEANDIDTSAVLPGADAQLDALTNQVATGRGGKLAMRAGIDVEDEAYKGRRTSRKAWFDDVAADQQGGSGSEDDDGDDGEEGLDGEEDEEDEEDVPAKRQKRGPAGLANGHAGGASSDEDDEEAGGSSGDWDEDGEGEEGSDDEQPSEERDGGGDGGEEDEELRQLEAGYRQLQEAEGKAVAQIQERGRKDAVKGRAARNQQALYERCLELRIMLQKGVLGSNRLPLPHTSSLISRLSQPGSKKRVAPEDVEVVQGLQERLQAMQTAARSALTELMTLHDTLVTSPQALSQEAVSAPAPQPSQDGSLDAFWDALSNRYDGLAAFRDASIDRWHSRAVLGSGSATLQGNLRALHQSISKQVSSMMQDPHKLIQRCRVAVVPGHRHMGEPQGQGEEVGSEGGEDVQAQDGYGGVVTRDEETFDDGEFYQQLLKEFLEQGGAGDGLNSARAAKKRKLVDRRASKGRKIRYNVQEKLVNFMSAVHMEPPVFAEQLFANLFGHSSTA